MRERFRPRMDFSIRIHRLRDLDPQLPVVVRKRGVQRGHRDCFAPVVWYLVEYFQDGRRFTWG